MTVYAVVLVNVTDADGYAEYGRGFMEIFGRYEGQLLAMDTEPTVLEGEWPHQRSILMSFPSAEAFDAWYHSPEYQTLSQHRFSASTARFVMLHGLG